MFDCVSIISSIATTTYSFPRILEADNGNNNGHMAKPRAINTHHDFAAAPAVSFDLGIQEQYQKCVVNPSRTWASNLFELTSSPIEIGNEASCLQKFVNCTSLAYNFFRISQGQPVLTVRRYLLDCFHGYDLSAALKPTGLHPDPSSSGVICLQAVDP